MIKNIKKKPILFIFLALLLIGVGTTIALFTNSYTFNNTFKSADSKIVLEENFTPTPWIENTPTTKEVYITNNGDSDVVVRLSYEELWSKKVGSETHQISNIVDGQNVVKKKWTDGFLSSDNWVLKDDGYYYYKKILKGNSRIQILKSIELDYDLIEKSGEDYLSYDYELVFEIETVQPTSEAIKSVWGLNATIANDNVNW